MSNSLATRQIRGVRVPAFLYGTAWKEADTARLTSLALASGFRGIDTANQRKHYFEAAVGEALSGAIERDELTREDVFLQTKFTYQAGQDQRLPYDPDASYGDQVAQSFDSSLEHLRTDHIDSYVLHGPMFRRGLSEADVTVWRAMEKLHASGRVKLLGVSNVNLEQLRELAELAEVKPAFVQNRCFAHTAWDRDVRRYCADSDLIYQGFSLLTANRPVFAQQAFGDIVQRVQRAPTQVIFRFAMQRGMLPLTGTTSPEHMKDDLACDDFELSPDDLDCIETILL
jgi:diketogulonate reductase-like aldo/keto reductase